MPTRRHKRHFDVNNNPEDHALREHCFWRTNNIPAPLRDGGFRKLPKYTPRGLPDIIVIKDGRFVGLGVKKKGSYQTPD